MTTRLNGSVRLYAVKRIWPEVDGATVANIGLPGFANPAHESQCSLGMGNGKTSSPAGLYFVADDAEHRRESVRETAVIFTRPPFRHILGLADCFLFVFPPCLLCLFRRSIRFSLANSG